MKRLHCLLSVILFSCLIIPQTYSQYYYFDYWPYQSKPCPWDSTQTLLTSQNWYAYQTKDDRWDGPIDSSRCIAIISSQISLSDIDPVKPVFIRYRMPIPNSYVLWPDQLYINRYDPIRLTGNSTFLLADSTCPNQQCTGLQLGIEIPDSAGTGNAMRWYSGNFSRDPFTFESGFCFPSEKFQNQLIKEVFFRIQIDRFDLASKLLLPAVNIQEHIFFQPVTSFTVPNTSSSPGINLIDQYLMMHADSTYPGPGNPYYIDVSLQPPDTQQKTIFLTIDPFAYLTGQPFTELRGDTVIGGNGIRHRVVIVNRGGSICFAFLEVVLRKGNGYRHEAGKLAFQHPSGCMAFHAGSFLEVADGQTLRYGEDGLGVILLKEGVDVRLEQQAELRIANRLVLDGVTADGNVHIYLPPDRKLSFAKSAQIMVGSKSANPNAKLVVHLRGGELDDDQLAATSRRHILRLVEDGFSSSLQSARILYPGNGGAPFLRFFSHEDMNLNMSLYDLNGRVVHQEKVYVRQGLHTLPVYVNSLSPAIYVLRLSNHYEEVGLKILLK